MAFATDVMGSSRPELRRTEDLLGTEDIYQEEQPKPSPVDLDENPDQVGGTHGPLFVASAATQPGKVLHST